MKSLIERSDWLLYDQYARAITDGWIHIRKSDRKHLQTVNGILEAIEQEGEVIAVSPEMAGRFINEIQIKELNLITA